VKLESIQDNIPIIKDDVAKFLQDYIHQFKVKRVLEIGTAYSYSAHVMAEAGAEVFTIERHPIRMNKAQSFIEQSQYAKNIHLIKEDAKNIHFDIDFFDLIFIDGAKSQYQNFFKRFSMNLKQDGIIVCDNMFFHHLKKEDVKRPTRQLLKKLENFHVFLNEHEKFNSDIYEIGDGLSISYRKDIIISNEKHSFLKELKKS
jgi:predicted O-methyltransferase YrrM